MIYHFRRKNSGYRFFLSFLHTMHSTSKIPIHRYIQNTISSYTFTLFSFKWRFDAILKLKKKNKIKKEEKNKRKERNHGAFITLALTRFFGWKEVTGLEGRSRAKKSLRKNRGENRWVSFPPLSRCCAIDPRGRDSRATTMEDRCHGSAIRRSWPGSHRRSLGMSRAFVSQSFPRKYRGFDDDDNEPRCYELCTPWFLVRRFESKGCATDSALKMTSSVRWPRIYRVSIHLCTFVEQILELENKL